MKLSDNGEMEYLGRIDHQVKIRGFRIELGEIENQLLTYDGVKDAVVLVGGNGIGERRDKYLCAYIVAGREFTVPDVREYLSRKLPDYMIPACFIQLDKIPLNVNGKVDRRTLSQYEFKLSAGQYTAPPALGPTTTDICGITPEQMVLQSSISPTPHKLATPS